MKWNEVKYTFYIRSHESYAAGSLSKRPFTKHCNKIENEHELQAKIDSVEIKSVQIFVSLRLSSSSFRECACASVHSRFGHSARDVRLCFLPNRPYCLTAAPKLSYFSFQFIYYYFVCIWFWSSALRRQQTSSFTRNKIIMYPFLLFSPRLIEKFLHLIARTILFLFIFSLCSSGVKLLKSGTEKIDRLRCA